MAIVAEREFRHEAVFYRDLEGFLEGTLPFVEGALEAGEPVMVRRGPRQSRGPATPAGRSRFTASPSSTWLALGATRAGSSPPGRTSSSSTPAERCAAIGEPAWPGRDGEELIECDHHESLLNLALSQLRPLAALPVRRLPPRPRHARGRAAQPPLSQRQRGKPREPRIHLAGAPAQSAAHAARAGAPSGPPSSASRPSTWATSATTSASGPGSPACPPSEAPTSPSPSTNWRRTASSTAVAVARS